MEEQFKTEEEQFKAEEQRFETPKRKKLKTGNFVLIAVCVLLLVAAVYYFIPERPDAAAVADFNTFDDEPAVTEVVEATPLSEYLDNFEKYENRRIEVDGYLMYRIEGTANEGFYEYKLADREGNEVYLKEIPSVYKSLFTKGKTTEEKYTVSGKFVRDHDKLLIEVYKIE